MDFFKQMLGNIARKQKKGSAVGLYISQSSYLEMVEYDIDKDEIKKYVKVPFEYDSILREINIESFETTLQKLMRNFSIASQTPIIVTLPSIFISKKALPAELEAEEVATALTSETEKNYIFKKSEPKVSWNVISVDKEAQVSTIIYSALQKAMVSKIEDVFKRQGLHLVSVESSYPSFIRGLAVSGLVHDYIDNNLSWHVLLVRNNINAVISLQGSQVVNISENPMALKSLEIEDLYPAIASSINAKIGDLPVDSLVIVNYSSIIDTKKLVKSIGYSCQFLAIEDNNFEGEPLFSAFENSAAESVSPEVIGSACFKNAPVLLNFNFIDSGDELDVPDFLASIGVIGNPVHLVLLSLIAVSLAVVLLISLVAFPVNAMLKDQYRELYAKCNKYAKLNEPQQAEFNIYNVVEKGFINNEKLITSYDAISAVIPEKIWITSLKIDDSLITTITGRAYNVEDIVTYYQNLLNVAKFSSLKIKSIKVVGENDNSDSTGKNSDVSINVQNNNPAINKPPSDNKNSLLPLPPPPGSLGAGNPILMDSGEKYYEFNFSNAPDPPKAPAEGTEEKQPAFDQVGKN